MPDIKLIQDTRFPLHSNVTLDWLLLDDGTLDDTQALATSVMVALGTDRLADRSDILPDPDSTDRRGWWGDLDAEEIWQGWPVGSRLWLLMRDKIVGPGAFQGATVVRVEQYIREAIQPFVDLKIASRFDVEVSRQGREQINAVVRMYRGPQLAIELRYAVLWEGILESNPTEKYYSGHTSRRTPFAASDAEVPAVGQSTAGQPIGLLLILTKA